MGGSRACQRALAPCPDDAELLFLEGALLTESGDYQGAKAALVRLLGTEFVPKVFNDTRFGNLTLQSIAGYSMLFDGEEDGPTMGDRLADPRPSQENHVAGLELKVRVQNALKQLSPELREAVILRDLEDMDYKEISLVLRIPEGTVKSRISRGRGELARLLQRIES